jgi:hypothetical protein
MSLEGWKSFFEIGGVILLLLTFAFGAGALIVNNRLNAIQAKELGDFRIKFEEEQQKTALAQKEVAEAKKAAGDADSKAEGFRLDIAKANERAAEATLALAKLKQPRVLTREQQERIFSKIKQFSGQSFAAYTFQDQESIDFANAVGRILLGANWVVQTPDSDIAIGKLGTTIFTGVQVEFAPSRANDFRSIAETLASALTEEGIPCKAMAVPFREKSANAIHIVVGKKPT